MRLILDGKNVSDEVKYLGERDIPGGTFIKASLVGPVSYAQFSGLSSDAVLEIDAQAAIEEKNPDGGRYVFLDEKLDYQGRAAFRRIEHRGLMLTGSGPGISMYSVLIELLDGPRTRGA